MTTCGDDAIRLQYLTRNWPHFKPEEVPTTFPQFSNEFSSNDMTNHDMAKLQEQAALVNNGVDNHVMAAILRHRLEMCLSQINQPQNANDGNLSFKEEQPPIIAIPPPNHNQQMKLENIDNAKEVMQQLVADKSNSQPYNSSLPWPNLMAMAVNRNANGMDSSKAAFLAGFENQNQESRSHGLQGLGTLLPPPPLIPVTTLPMLTPHVIAASFAASSSTSSHVTTSSPLDLTRALNEGNPKHTSSSGDSKIQPLDLRTCSRKRQLSEEMDVTPAHLSHAILQGAPDQQMAFPISSSAYLPSSQPATSTTSAFSAMSTQQIAALAPYLQNNAIMRAMYGQQLQNMNPIMQNGANQDYMRKWLLATAQQHHQAAAVQSPSQKRPRLDEMAQQQNKQRLSFHSYSAAGKDIQMANRRNESPGPNSPSNLHSSKNSGNGTTGKRYKRYAKPPYSYVSLITLAILSSPEKKLRLSQILKRIAEMFPFFNGTYQGWRDSVRHNLSQNECFVKVLKNPYRPTAKGNYWTVNITAIPHELLLRQNTLVSRFAQDSGFRFRKDLTEIFDLSTGQVKIDMPRRMLSGTGLIDDPATVMEALLLEQKKDDEPVCPIPALTGKVYSLLDIFVQDDVHDDVALRMSNSNNRWGSKSARSRSNAHAQKPMIQVSAQQNDFTPHVYPQYDSQKLAMQNSNPATLNQLNNNQVQAQKEFWSKALSGQIPALPGLPFLQNYFAKAHQGNGILSNILLQTQEPNDQGRSVPACSSSDKLNPTSPKEDKVADVADDELQLSNWNQGGEKRNRRKSMQPTRRYSQDKENVKEENPLSPNSRVGSFVDSGIVGSMSPRSPTRSFSSDADAISGPPVIEQSPFVRSRSSDLLTETIASSPREVQEDVVPTSPVRFPPTFQRFNPCPPVEAGKMM
ncbi:uncharacterized protein LOC143463139 isoform X1 [Clavelina lepadiformis]|uniref:uncharacterized protein LOC143463139 isoform X1 n=1 Tax=Clavelina lepadiformis TaxID=159417 RepID=UPI004042BA5C